MTSMQLRRRHAKRPWKSMAFVWRRHSPQGGGATGRYGGGQADSLGWAAEPVR